MKNSAQKLRKTLLKFDLFGEPVGFTIDGDGSRKSCLGLLLSLIIIATLIPYSFKKFDTLITYGDNQVSMQVDNQGKQPSDRTKI